MPVLANREWVWNLARDEHQGTEEGKKYKLHSLNADAELQARQAARRPQQQDSSLALSGTLCCRNSKQGTGRSG